MSFNELNSVEHFITLPSNIAHWPSFLQHGIKSRVEIDLIEMGLIDRIAVLEVAKHLETARYASIKRLSHDTLPDNHFSEQIFLFFIDKISSA